MIVLAPEGDGAPLEVKVIDFSMHVGITNEALKLLKRLAKDVAVKDELSYALEGEKSAMLYTFEWKNLVSALTNHINKKGARDKVLANQVLKVIEEEV